MLQQFSRKNEKTTGTLLPEKWVNKLSELIQETFPELRPIKMLHWGEYFKDELLLITSLYNETHGQIPYTIIISMDVNSNNDKELKKILDRSTQILGMIIEDYLQTTDDFDYFSGWLESKAAQDTFYYTITREDILLTLEANKIFKL